MRPHVTFDTLPQAVMSLHEKLDDIGNKIESLSKQQAFSLSDDTPIGVDEAAKLLQLSKAAIYAKVYRNRIPYYKAGGKLYFSKIELIGEIHSGRRPAQQEQKTEDSSPVFPQVL